MPVILRAQSCDWAFFVPISTDDLVKSHQADGKVKSSRYKARTSFKAVRRNLEG